MSEEREEIVRSPCVSICALDENDICIGCSRSGDEIINWGRYSSQQRKEVLKKVAEREHNNNAS